jgi:hypothetical protein
MCNNAFTAPALAPVPGAATYTPPPPAVPPAPSGDAIAAGAPPQTAPAPLPPPGDYIAHKSIWFSPRVLPWVALGALLLVFILSFFPWGRSIGTLVGEPGIVSQSAWQAAFGSFSVYPADKDKDRPKASAEEEGAGGVNLLLLFYIIFFIILLLVTAAAVVVDLVPISLPPGLQPVLPLRWAIVAGLTGLTFLLLLIQLLVGFRVENAIVRNVDKMTQKDYESSDEKVKTGAILNRYTTRTFSYQRTTYLTVAVLLHFVALVCSLLMFLGDPRRGRPVPRVELAW